MSRLGVSIVGWRVAHSSTLRLLTCFSTSNCIQNKTKPKSLTVSMDPRSGKRVFLRQSWLSTAKSVLIDARRRRPLPLPRGRNAGLLLSQRKAPAAGSNGRGFLARTFRELTDRAIGAQHRLIVLAHVLSPLLDFLGLVLIHFGDFVSRVTKRMQDFV